MECIVQFTKLFHKTKTVTTSCVRINDLIMVTLPDDRICIDIKECQLQVNIATTKIISKKTHITLIITNEQFNLYSLKNENKLSSLLSNSSVTQTAESSIYANGHEEK
ncbi:Hypothetical_protein [Hexamita inflata]|uniref:Hypothetical_protein n=1 Tax=Hexamita inflata TaxID=28002 RepID=A0AA86NXF5_9EUKA|nr:Hypothetical protein HINF_LOCUS14783 [Hexamita inflata]